MLTFLGIVALCAGIVWVVNRKLSKNVPAGVLTLTTKVEKTAKDVLDVNNDNKITVEDAKQVVKNVKKTATKAAAKVKKPRNKKPTA